MDTLALAPAPAARIDDPCDAWPASPFCSHSWHKTPYRLGMCIIYECVICGEEYEKDVS